MNNNYYLNTKRYLKDGKRLAIFGKEVVKGEVEIFILRCSKEDRFYKKVAKQIYEYYLEHGLEKMKKLLFEYHPIIQNVVIEEGNTARWTFDRFCDLYYSKYSGECGELTLNPFGELNKAFTIKYEYLYCGDEIIPIKNSLKFAK